MSEETGKQLAEESLVAQVATLAMQQVPEYRIAESLKLTRYKVRKVMASDEFKAYLKELSERAAQVALAAFKSKIESLEPLAFAALKHNLEEKKLESVRLWAEFAGLKDRQEGNAGAGNLTVVLPGAQAPEKEAESQVVELIQDGGKE